MCPDRMLRRKNIENISANSVTTDEISDQRKELAAAERRLDRMESKVEAIREKVAQSRQRVDELRSQARAGNKKTIRRMLETSKNRLSTLRQQRDNILQEYRELKLMVRDQRALVTALEKKEAARQLAVARFLRKWERDYGRKMRRKKKNAQIRKGIS